MKKYSKAWKDWIGDEAYETMRRWGYFSMDFRKADGGIVQRGSRVIVLNTQAANGLNWWLLGERNDPGNHMAWLEQELREVEEAKGIAYIIGHI